MARSWLRFLVLGVALFVAHEAWTRGPGARDLGPEAGVALDDETLLFRVALARGMHRGDAVVRDRLVRNLRFAWETEAADAELFEQALALGLHETDLVVRRRLAQRMRLALEAPASSREPDDAELDAWRARHAARWQRPARRDLRQIPFAQEAGARDALPALRGPDAGTGLGDPLPVPGMLARHARRDLVRLLGGEFADAAFAAPVGRWSGPVRSAYGWHLLFVEAHEDGGPAPLASVRAEVRGHWLEAQREAAREAGIAALRERGSVPRP